jgi:wobble nucleotide-excising tRNase
MVVGENRPLDEVDVREVLQAIRQELASQTADPEESHDLASTDLQVIHTHHNVREFTLGTDRRLAPVVVAAKKLVELIVKPYAGHFLDKQAHFNASLNRIITGMVKKLDDLNGQLLSIRDEQIAMRETIEREMADVRSRLDTLRAEATGQYESLRNNFAEELQKQTRELHKQGAARQLALEQAKVELYRQLEETRDEVSSVSRQLEQGLTKAVENLQTRFAEVEKRTVESQRDVEVRLAKELAAIVDFLEEILPAP